MGYALEQPARPEQWTAFHAIRRVELFEARGRIGVYDADHADDRTPANSPLLLSLDGARVGVMRLDNRGDGTGIVRLVAVAAAAQGRGHGRVLQALLEARCRGQGIHTLFVNSAPAAIGFYEKTGWTRFVWDEAELAGIAAGCIQMRRPVPEEN
jgi:N-acetylglutamate synthase-like GNAT family acetyltransferase